MSSVRNAIINGETALGIEFGSTRIKAILVGQNNKPIVQGSHDWENRFVDGVWTYTLEDIWSGLQDCYKNLADNVKRQYDVELETVGALGFSGMMHGYMPFDKEGVLLAPFRTWRNTITEKASIELTELFKFHIPQRWSIAHLYQSILNQESHVKDIDFFTTLAGYIHWQLTGEKVLGVGEASGMFPIDLNTRNWNKTMIQQFDELIGQNEFGWNLEDILPKVLLAGEKAGVLSEKGARLLDPTGKLKAGIVVCPPEGDAGTGMVATNSIKVRTGSVSAGTSAFGMIVLEKELKKVHDEIDVVTTPAGDLVAMAHCNNCTSDINAWVGLFDEFAQLIGLNISKGELFEKLFMKALEGDADCGNLLAYNYFSGEHITGFEKGRPLFTRLAECRFNLANFMRTHLYASLAVVKVGMDILLKEEGVKVNEILGHGGLFKTQGVGQRILAAALNTPVSVMETAGEGGAWGIAVLASYMKNKGDGESLEEFLDMNVFEGQKGTKMDPDPAAVDGFNKFMENYLGGLAIERAAVNLWK